MSVIETELMDSTGIPNKVERRGYPKDDYSSKILKARIALLSTAIGGPDHSSQLDPPPYKLGDDCLACLKDLKRWFKLVDDKQSRWDVAAAAAQFNVFTDDLMPILIEWENKSARAVRKAKKKGGKIEDYFRNKSYHDKIALNALQLMVLMTWPLILTDQSTLNQVNHYSELKKHQLIYKKAMLSADNGKVLRAAIRIALEVIKMDKLLRSPKDNVILRLVLNFFRNVVAIEPSELTISSKKSLNRGINSTDMLPPNVSADDVSLNSVITSFDQNKVFDFLLTLTSSVNREFDASFINVPILELIFYLIKNVNHEIFFPRKVDYRSRNASHLNKSEGLTRAGAELSQLLQKEQQLKKSVIRNTSTRHSRFGTSLSIQTSTNQRLTISGGQDLLNSASSLKKLDASKKWNKRVTMKNETIEGLPSNFLNFNSDINYWNPQIVVIFKNFIVNFIDAGFDPLLHSVTDHFTTEDDEMAVVHQIQYLLFYAWFVKYQMLQSVNEKAKSVMSNSSSLKDTSFVLVSQLLRRACERKVWAVVHAGMIAFMNLLCLINSLDPEYEETIQYIKNRLFTDDRLQLLSSLPKTASNHSPAYIKSCIHLTHVVLRTIKKTSENVDLASAESNQNSKQRNTQFSVGEITRIAEEEGIEYEEAAEALESSFKQITINFNKIERAYMVGGTVDTYMIFLQRFKELEDEDVKKAIQFFHHIFVLAKEESLLFRIDFMILLKDLLAPDGLPTNSRSREHVSKFANYYMTKLNERLKKSPSWFVSILFPTLNDKEISYYQKYGKVKTYSTDASQEITVVPTTFKDVSQLMGMSDTVLTDFKYGVLVSTLIDDGKMEYIDELLKNLKGAYEVFHSWLLQNIVTDQNEDSSISEPFQTAVVPIQKALVSDSDFRALLKLVGYHIPSSRKDRCFLRLSVGVAQVELATSLLTKYRSTTFDTPNNLPSSSYLCRPKSNFQNSDEDPELDPFIDDTAVLNTEDGQQEGLYFQELGTTSISALDKKSRKGTATTKKRHKDKRGTKQRSSRNPDLPANFDSIAEKSNSRHVITSKEYVSDSDDSDDDILSPIFFENEMYLRWLLDKHDGLLPDAKYNMFANFCIERMAKQGKFAVEKYLDLFDGPVPLIEDLRQSETFSDLSSKIITSANKTENAIIHEPKIINSKQNLGPDALESDDLNESIQLTESSDEDNSSPIQSERIDTKIAPARKRILDEEEEDDYSQVSITRKKAKLITSDEED